jgi:hypothetical protein
MRFSRVLLSIMFVTAGLTLGAVGATAQIWWVQSADYGAGNRRQDVTNVVRRLVNGPNFKVTNYNLGGDPAVGRDKSLRIVAKDASGTVRDFYYKEGHQVNAQMFNGGPGSGRPGWPGWPGGPGGPGNGYPGNGGGNSYGLVLTSAKWGAGAKQMDVTNRLQGMVRNNRLSVQAINQTMGGDPSRGNTKTLTVLYQFRGRSGSQVASEGNWLNIP